MEVETKVNKNLNGIVIILVILVLGLGGYIAYDKVLNKDNKTTVENNSKTDTNAKNKNAETNKNNIEDNKNETNKSLSSKARCYGTYYVNGSASDGIYTLNEDGTWKVENQEKYGVFVINENTITFIESKHVTGPREEDPIYYNPKSYLISDDCSTIRLTESGAHVSASLDKVQ